MAAITGGIIAALGGLASLAVFVFPTADGRMSREASPTTSPPAATSSSAATDQTGASTAPPDPAPSSDQARSLGALTPSVGAGLVTPLGQDLQVDCPSNQSDDTEREISYDLKGPYQRFDATVSLVGTADPDDSVAVRVFIGYRQERSDRRAPVGQAVARANQKPQLTAPLTGATHVSLVVLCSSSQLKVRIGAPTIVR
jgi:hypothetical protein